MSSPEPARRPFGRPKRDDGPRATFAQLLPYILEHKGVMSLVVVLSVRGRDYEYRGKLSPFAEKFYYAGRGVGPFTHTAGRPAGRYGGTVSVRTGARYPSFLLLPVIPGGVSG